MRVALAAVVAAVLLAVAGVIAWSLRSPATVALITAVHGGTVTTGDGVSVRFGPGALTQDTRVRIAPRPSIAAPDGLTWLAEPVDIALGGARLRTFATVTLPLRDPTGDGLTTVVSRDDEGVWSSQGGTVDPGAGTITTVVGHLSIVSAGRATVTAPGLAPGTGAYDAPEPECGTTRSGRWTARAEGAAVKTCVAAGAADRSALLRVAGNRAYGQFAELGAYPQMVIPPPHRPDAAATVWRELAAADPAHTYLPGRGTLDLALPGNYRTIEFVLRTGPEVTVAEYVVEVMSAAFVPPRATVRAVRCALAQPRPDQVAACVHQALATERILPGTASATDEKRARQHREKAARAVRTAMRGLPAVVTARTPPASSSAVVAQRSPVIPRKALNEPGGTIPAAVLATQERLYGAAVRDALPEVLPPPGLIWSNTGLTGPRVTDAVAALVTTPPLRWPCDETSRDGYVYGLADHNLLTYPARLIDLGMPAEDVGIVRQTAGNGKNYRLCVALDGTWTSLTYNMPAGGFPADEAARLGAAGPGDCRLTLGGPFLPPDAGCRRSVRTDLDGDGGTDTLLLYERAGTWTARAILAAGRVSDLTLPYEQDRQPAPVADLDLDGEPGEEVVLGTGPALRLLSWAPEGPTLIGSPFTTVSTLSRTAGLGCADLDHDGRPELLEAAATFERDPATGAIVAARTTETRWNWSGKALSRGETIVRELTGIEAGDAAAPPYRDVTCSWR
ncbi:hypothetical protein [Actinoplanes sp. M2I2]|uniref:hypothetical protein n=1 Tax=Actinoplanes sp. M2I2 TaxID=1734444 RepID=UPI002020C87F|nr:hypothetical protein [Actinoplanes sp. M2I2]